MRNTTPEEAFTGVKLEVDHLRIFCCSVYIHVPKEKRTKLESLGRKGTFVGYSESLKAYMIYNPRSRQIEVNRDVSFEEKVAMKRTRGSDTEIDGEELVAPKEIYHLPLALQQFRGIQLRQLNLSIPLIQWIKLKFP